MTPQGCAGPSNDRDGSKLAAGGVADRGDVAEAVGGAGGRGTVATVARGTPGRAGGGRNVCTRAAFCLRALDTMLETTPNSTTATQMSAPKSRIARYFGAGPGGGGGGV